MDKEVMNKKRMLGLFFLLILCVNLAFATPREIIIIRHADKLRQAEQGPSLSPKGIVRSLAFAFYYLDKFGEPDYIFATHPRGSLGKNTSMRELQTVAPLANMLALQRPNYGFPILHPYKNADFEELANYILNKKNFDGKQILICWNHKKIPLLAKKLGVKEPLPHWPTDDFDSVYVLQYDRQGKLIHFEILNQQYPVAFDGTWKALYAGLQNGNR